MNIDRSGDRQERSRRRIVFLGGRNDARNALAANDENLSVGEQSRTVSIARDAHEPGGAENPGEWVVKLRLRRPATGAGEPARQQNLSAIENRSPVKGSRAGHLAGWREEPAGRVVKLRGRRWDAVAVGSAG